MSLNKWNVLSDDISKIEEGINSIKFLEEILKSQVGISAPEERTRFTVMRLRFTAKHLAQTGTLL